jgi:hypothetical protein
MAGGSQATTGAEFDAMTRYFVAPDPAEGFTVNVYEAEGLDSART